ncbi:hypothetical protein yc1106_07552 [Curvularia clavata]|uniref:Uncharacterized protein n=1 Tax=Curvularia clavata TaxID=95742 RepID=A0A9Q8ZGH4_CURCL|nr:hypothetical protein yc1106_07552 [Curvularia clavata]
MELGPYYDPLGEFEMHTTPYKLTVLVPPRLPLKQSLLNFIRTPSAKRTQDPSGYSPLKELSGLPQKTVVLKSAYFPWQMRCKHVKGNDGFKQGVKGCKEGCYILEKGGDGANWKCAHEDCEGHVYCGDVLQDEEGRCCFGKKGERMVCLTQEDDN